MTRYTIWHGNEEDGSGDWATVDAASPRDAILSYVREAIAAEDETPTGTDADLARFAELSDMGVAHWIIDASAIVEEPGRITIGTGEYVIIVEAVAGSDKFALVLRGEPAEGAEDE